MVPRQNVAFVVVGDDVGPIRTPLDAMEMNPDRFVSRPLSEKAVRFAVQSALEVVALRTTQPNQAVAPPRAVTQQGVGIPGAVPAIVDDDPTSAKAMMRARWAAIADSIGGDDLDDDEDDDSGSNGASRDSGDLVEDQ